MVFYYIEVGTYYIWQISVFSIRECVVYQLQDLNIQVDIVQGLFYSLSTFRWNMASFILPLRLFCQFWYQGCGDKLYFYSYNIFTITFSNEFSRCSTRLYILARFCHVSWFPFCIMGGGGALAYKGVWGCAALKTPFSRLSCSSQGSHLKQKSQFTRPPFEKIWKFRLYSLNFCPHFSSQAPKFRYFQFTSPLFQRQVSVRKPHILEIRAALFYLKKSWVPPPHSGALCGVEKN